MQNKDELTSFVAKFIEKAHELQEAQGNLIARLEQEGELNDAVFDIMNEIADGEYDDVAAVTEALVNAMAEEEEE